MSHSPLIQKDGAMKSPPAWLADLANHVATEMYPIDLLAPLGCHYHLNDEIPGGQCEITVFAASTEIVGGEFDGKHQPSKFCLDLRNMLKHFDQIETFHWQTAPVAEDDELGAHVSIEGEYQGQSVWLRVVAEAPKRFSCGRQANVYELKLEDVW